MEAVEIVAGVLIAYLAFVLIAKWVAKVLFPTVEIDEEIEKLVAERQNKIVERKKLKLLKRLDVKMG